jgi:hypothetical protein
METIGEWVLLMSFETTTAGRTLVASAPTAGSKLTRKMSPRLIDSIAYRPFEFPVDPGDLVGGRFVFGRKPAVTLLFESTRDSLGNEAASFARAHFPRDLFEEILGQADVDADGFHSHLTVCIIMNNNKTQKGRQRRVNGGVIEEIAVCPTIFS